MARAWGRLLVRLGVGVGSILLTLLLVEGALRLVPEEIVGGSYWGHGAFEAFEPAGYRHAPGFVGRASRAGAFVSPVSIDELGLRHGELGRPRDARHGVLVLGDSFPFGLGVREDENLPTLLARSLGPEVAVVNGAQTGYGIGQSTAFGRWLVPQVDPAAVLLTVFLANDLEGEYFADWKAIDLVRGFRLPKERMRSAGADWLRTHTRVGLLVHNRVHRAMQRSRKGEFRAAKSAAAAALVDRVVEPILEAALEWRAEGRVFGVVMIPPRGRATAEDDYFRARMEQAGIPVLDLAGELGRDHYNARDGHWNAAGHARTAALVEPFVRELLVDSLATRKDEDQEPGPSPAPTVVAAALR
jgi:hypothetical protein